MIVIWGAKSGRHRTAIGPTTVGLEWDQNALRFAWMTQPIPTFGPIVTDSVAVAAAVGVQPCDLADGNVPVQVAPSGVPFLYVPLRSRGGRRGIHRAWEIVHVTPFRGSRRAPCICILGPAGGR
jgi:predicted PhzF superfamily epimerase YddE/YHI9